MKPSRLSIIALLPLFAIPVRAQTPSGLEIMREYQRRHEARSEKSQLLMQIYDRQGRVKERELSILFKQGEDGRDKALLKFLAPADIRNVGLLTWEGGEGVEDDQWLYLPADQSVRRIAGGNKKSDFMGTDLTFEDLRSEDLDSHTYEVVGEEETGGQLCWVMEALPSTPKEKRETGYGMRRLWIRKDIYFIIRVEFFNHSNKLIKTATFDELQQVHDQRWRSDRSTFERILTRTKTVMTTHSRELDIDLPDSLFTQQGLKRPPGREYVRLPGRIETDTVQPRMLNR
jgi:hypothetical protein